MFPNSGGLCYLTTRDARFLSSVLTHRLGIMYIDSSLFELRQVPNIFQNIKNNSKENQQMSTIDI